MKKLLIIFLCSFSLSAFSQNDSLYAMKNGVIIHSFSIDSNHIDSIIFYRPNITTPSITDADGNVYTSLTIGTQEWMSENLRTTKYSDGTPIPNVTDETEWYNDTTGAWCHYDNDNKYDTIYGKLYNFYAVETGKLCPTGWHVPTFYEWNVLKTYLMEKGHREGTVLKSTLGWNDHIGKSGNGTDNYGWSGLPGGRRNYSGGFSAIGEIGYWWSSTAAIDLNMAEITSITNSRGGLYGHLDFNRLGASVRCLRD